MFVLEKEVMGSVCRRKRNCQEVLMVFKWVYPSSLILITHSLTGGGSLLWREIKEIWCFGERPNEAVIEHQGQDLSSILFFHLEWVSLPLTSCFHKSILLFMMHHHHHQRHVFSSLLFIEYLLENIHDSTRSLFTVPSSFDSLILSLIFHLLLLLLSHLLFLPILITKTGEWVRHVSFQDFHLASLFIHSLFIRKKKRKASSIIFVISLCVHHEKGRRRRSNIRKDKRRRYFSERLHNFSLNENVILRNKPQVICWLESQALLSFRDCNSASTFLIIPSN